MKGMNLPSFFLASFALPLDCSSYVTVALTCQPKRRKEKEVPQVEAFHCVMSYCLASTLIHSASYICWVE